MSEAVRYLVISDIHAFAGPITADSPSSLSASDTSSFPDELFQRCADAVLENFGSVEAILVAGDLADRASTPALKFVWAKLQQLGILLDAPVIATAGNHDLDSRGIYSTMPNEALLNLEPPFPDGSKLARSAYFSEHHALVRTPNSVVLTINSAAHHGYVFDGAREEDHGRVVASVDRWIQRSLREAGELPSIRILLTHHHPVQLPDFDTSEASATVGADGLMRVLSEFGDWMVIHGHKHRGWVHYAAGGGDAPVILSASSFSANLGDDDFGRLVKRQFHIVEYHDPLGPFGLIHSWNHDGSAWVRAHSSHMLSGLSGFGWRASVEGLARSLRAEVADKLTVSAAELQLLEPRIRFLSFDDRSRLLGRLIAGKPAVGHLLSDVGEISELHLRTEPKA